MLLWMVGVASLILAAVIAWSYFTVLDRLENEAIQRVASLAEGSAANIDTTLRGIEGLVQGIATTIEALDGKIGFSELNRALEQGVRENDAVFGLSVAFLKEETPAGWAASDPYVYRTGKGYEHTFSAPGDDSFIGEDWFYLPRYLERPVWTEPYQESAITDRKVQIVSYSVPLYRGSGGNRRFAGIAVCDIELDWLEKVIANLPLGKNGYGLLMSRNGTYISHPMPEIVFNESVFSLAEDRGNVDLRLTGKRMTSGFPGIQDFVSFAKAEPAWLAWHPVSSAGWTIGVLLSKAELRAEVLLLARNEALVGFAGLLVLAVAVFFVSSSITKPVRSLGQAASSLSGGNLDAVLPLPKGNDEVARLAIAFTSMRDNLKQYIRDLAETTASRERLNGELRIAHDIQMDLVPKTFPAFPNRDEMDLFAVIEPAREVGGDFYDFFMLDEDHIVIAIGDVSGKGVPAALFMAVTRSFLRSEFHADSMPGPVMARVNDELSDGNQSCMFVTLFCAVITLSDGHVEYVNAGHNPPVRIHADGRTEWVMKPHGPAAGAMPGMSYESGHFTLEAGESLLLYTDGVTEAMNPDNQLYGESRLAEHCAGLAAADCRKSLETLLADIRAHAAGAEQSDDITMLIFKRFLTRRASQPQEGNAADAFAPQGRIDMTDHSIRIEIQSDLPAMDKALDTLDQWMEQVGASPALAYKARLVLEELGTNVVKYGYEHQAGHFFHVEMLLGPPATMTIEDYGITFDPTREAPEVDVDATAEEREIGGLGLHMVKQMTAGMEYRRESGRNILRITFKE